ncbi:MAG: TonB-dependent receptor [Bacteroidales bacterium]|nr:TonB-dependent receptor [Bacteroidales bacterium]
MRHVLLLFTTIIVMALSGYEASAGTGAGRQDATTLKEQMETMHEKFGVNFVYDSSINLDIPCKTESLEGLARSDRDSLETVLTAIFTGTGIEFEIMKKYVVLTKAGSKKKPKDYTILIEEQHDTINESVVTALADPQRNSTQTGLKRIDSKDINSGFAIFSTPDVIKTLQMMPGVASGTELLSGFYVHGGDGSDNLFLLDGVPVYQVSHLLGLFSSFNSDVIGSMDFYKSGFPARYGSKMSSIVDVTTRDGDFNDYHGLFSVGLIDGRFQFEGPIWKGKTSFNIGLRRTWTETISIPVIAYINKMQNDDSYDDFTDRHIRSRVNLRYAFTDLNAKITHKFSNTNVLSANFYTGRDIFKYLDDYETTSNDGTYSRDIMEASLSWGNVLGSLNWNYEFDRNLTMKNIAYYSGSLSGLSFYDRSVDVPGNDAKEGIYVNSDVHNIGLKSDFYHVPDSRHKLRYGGTVQYHIYNPNTTAKSDFIENNVSQTYVAYADSLRYDTFEASVYAEDEIALTDAFSVNAGLRYGIYATGEKIWHSLEPRVAMKYTFNEHITAKASYTEMSQPSHLLSSIYLDLPTNAWLPSTARIRPSRSREVAGGIYTDFSNNIHLNVEGWYKKMYNLLEYAGAYNIFPPLTDWENCYKSGLGRSWGAELDFGYDNGRTEANVYYTLSWSQRKFEEFYPDWYRDRNDNRHKLTLMAKHKFGKRLEIYGAWNWHSGNRITIATHSAGREDVYSEPNNVKLPDYHRLDVGLNFVKRTKRGNTSIWNLSLYNAYSRANAISAEMDWKWLDNEKFAYYGMSIGIIPIVPTFSYTLKF